MIYALILNINKESAEFALGKVHFGVGFHELLHFSFLVKLIRCGQALLLLSHIKHHLLHSGSCFPLKVWELWWFRVNLLRINLRITLDRAAPPRSLILPLLDIDVNILALISINFAVLNGPISFLRIYFTFPLSINQCYALSYHFEFIHRNTHFSCLFYHVRINENEHLQVLTLNKMLTYNVWVQIYLSVLPPFPFGAGSLSSYFFGFDSSATGCYTFGCSTTLAFCSAFFFSRTYCYYFCFFFFSASSFLFCSSF